jgi:hypothetical protein
MWIDRVRARSSCTVHGGATDRTSTIQNGYLSDESKTVQLLTIIHICGGSKFSMWFTFGFQLTQAVTHLNCVRDMTTQIQVEIQAVLIGECRVTTLN